MRFEVSRGKKIMKHENRIEDFFVKTKSKIKNYIELIFKIISKDNSNDSFEDCGVKKLNLNHYNRVRAEVDLQMLRDRNLF